METKLFCVSCNMRALRNRIGLSQDEVANELGIARATYNGYETNPRKVSIEVFYKLASMFKCNVKDFFMEFDVANSNYENK